MLLFDIDGTLISGGGCGRRAFERACRELYGLGSALSAIRLDGMTDPLILEHVFRERLGREASSDEAAQVIARYLEHLVPEVAKSEYRIHDGVVELLAHLAERGDLIGLATGNVKGGARIKLERGGLWQHFAFGGFGCDSPERAELVRVAIARGHERAGLRLEREEIIVIGDTPKDIAAAHAAGATAYAVATGSYSVDALAQAGADRSFASLREWLSELAA
jgi:phosphoglycolate phosphatase-like HAD superfamily hydrolase